MALFGGRESSRIPKSGVFQQSDERGAALRQFISVTIEGGEKILVNMETVAFVRRHQHEVATDHEHAPDVKLVQLKTIGGGDIIVQDDGEWGL